MGQIKLMGNAVTNCIVASTEFENSQTSATGLSIKPMGKNDVFFATFDTASNEKMTFNGADYNLDFTNLDKFLILRKDSDSDGWKIVGETSKDIKYFQDFLVGSTRKYEYRIMPVLNSNEGQQINSIIKTKIAVPIIDYITIVGTIPTNDSDVYEVDYNNVWIMMYATEIDDRTHQIGKTFTDTLGRFPKETVTQKNYIKSGAKGYAGDYVCPIGDYYEDYELIRAWENFCLSSNLKIIKDTRGYVIPCDIDSFTTGTEVIGNNLLTSVKITYTQLRDINDITVRSDSIMTYLQNNPIIGDTGGTAMASTEPKFIASDGR